MILIAGDSWGCGEISRGMSSVLHTGLEQYIVNENINSINVSQFGGSNSEAYNKIKTFLEIKDKINITEPITKILIFQTEWFRDFHGFRHPYPFENYCNYIFKHEYFNKDKVISSWYYRLSRLAQEHSVNMYLIGGSSDTIFLDKFSIEYPGLHIACQSMTNLIVNGNHRINDPVYGVSVDLFEEFSASDVSILESLIDDFNKAENRLNVWKDNPDYFWPDGSHPNRLGHKILFDFLKSTGVIHEHC